MREGVAWHGVKTGRGQDLKRMQRWRVKAGVQSEWEVGDLVRGTEILRVKKC